MPVLDPLSPSFEKELSEQIFVYDGVLTSREAFKENYLKALERNSTELKGGTITEAQHGENIEKMIVNNRIFQEKLEATVKAFELQDKFARDEERRRLQALPTEAVEAPVKAPAVDAATNALAPEATPLLKRDEYILPRAITQAYNTHEGKFFDKTKPERLVFQDDGVKLATATDDKKAIADMVTLAKSKNWGELKLSGSQEFRREAWLQAESQGIKTAGYTPKEADLAQLKTLQQERSKNTITPVGERQRETAAAAIAAAPAQRHDINKNQAALALAGEANKTANMATLKEKPAFQGISAKELEAVAFWRGIVMEENKDQPKPIQTTRLAEFDGKMEDSKNRAALPDPALASIESDVKVHAKEAKEHKTPEHDLSL
jgi:Large polyvalent protein-associated domain 7